jgi:hypothetical protein
MAFARTQGMRLHSTKALCKCDMSSWWQILARKMKNQIIKKRLMDNGENLVIQINRQINAGNARSYDRCERIDFDIFNQIYSLFSAPQS